MFGVQLADGDAELLGSLEEDVMHRRLPGSGDLHLAHLVAQLDGQGVRAPVGIEVWDEELLARGAHVAADELARSAASFPPRERGPGPVAGVIDLTPTE